MANEVPVNTRRHTTKLALVRHGDYGYDEKLSPLGISQIKQVGESLKPELSLGETSLILASPVLRTRQSADILSEILGANVEHHEAIASIRGQEENIRLAFGLISGKRRKGIADLLVVVTHMPYMCELPGLIGLQDFGEEILPEPIDEGCGVLINYNPPGIRMLP